VHAEANAIISASRKDMIGSSIYLTGIEMSTGEYVEKANSCAMCKRMIINAGISQVYIRDDKENYRVVDVNEWIVNDDSLTDALGY
jgi:dCMP deaminase